MTRTVAAIAAFFTTIFLFTFNLNLAHAADDYREMYATSSTGAEFIITNQACDINFGEPVPFKYHGYFVQDGVRYDACWYGNDAAIWFAVDHFRQITSLDPNVFRLRQNPKEFKGEY
jgi:hypothetical protein